MKICKQCGATNADNRYTCHNCGAQLPVPPLWLFIVLAIVVTAIVSPFLVYGLVAWGIIGWLGTITLLRMMSTKKCDWTSSDWAEQIPDDWNMTGKEIAERSKSPFGPMKVCSAGHWGKSTALISLGIFWGISILVLMIGSNYADKVMTGGWVFFTGVAGWKSESAGMLWTLAIGGLAAWAGIIVMQAKHREASTEVIAAREAEAEFDGDYSALSARNMVLLVQAAELEGVRQIERIEVQYERPHVIAAVHARLEQLGEKPTTTIAVADASPESLAPFPWEELVEDRPIIPKNIPQVTKLAGLEQLHIDTYIANNQRFWKTFHHELRAPFSMYCSHKDKSLRAWAQTVNNTDSLVGRIEQLADYPILKGEFIVAEAGAVLLTNYRMLLQYDSSTLNIPLEQLTRYSLTEHPTVVYLDTSGEPHELNLNGTFVKTSIVEAVRAAEDWSGLGTTQKLLLSTTTYSVERAVAGLRVPRVSKDPNKGAPQSPELQDNEGAGEDVSLGS